MRVEGQRPRQEEAGTVTRTGRGTFDDYRDIGGVAVPVSGEVAWVLDDGPFVYFRGTVTERDVAE